MAKKNLWSKFVFTFFPSFSSFSSTKKFVHSSSTFLSRGISSRRSYTPSFLSFPSYTPSLLHSSYISSSSSSSSFFSSFSSSKRTRNDIHEDFFSLVGNTPLVKLKKASEITKCQIYGKCEFANPGGSVKDRPACYIIDDAEQKGLLHRGEGRIVEGSAGNTAIGLALAAKCRGYKVVCVIPDNQCFEKIEAMHIAGCEVVTVPFQKIWHPNHFVVFSKRLAENLHAAWGGQFDNLANRRSHFETTGPEIWEQLDGKIDGFVSAVGTGGTLTGVGNFLREKNANIQVALADVPGAVLYRYYTLGLVKAVGSSITENIGQGRITGNLEGFRPDVAYEIPDEESLPWCYQLLSEEGLAVGLSTGVNVAGAVRLARQLGPGHTVVTLLCDYGQRYTKKQYNPEFLKSLNLPFPQWMENKPAQMPFEVDENLRDAYMASMASKEEVEEEEEKHKGSSSDPKSKA